MRIFSLSENQSIAIDAKQRTILVSKDLKNGNLIVCAELSPDVSAALANEIAAKAGIKELQATLSQSIKEQSSPLGKRHNPTSP